MKGASFYKTFPLPYSLLQRNPALSFADAFVKMLRMGTPPLLTMVDTRAIVRACAKRICPSQEGMPVEGLGSRYECENASYLFLEEIFPERLDASGGEQTTSVFQTIERVLASQGFAFQHLVRTWFYLDGILDWYGEFNAARTPFLKTHGALERFMPASTGIGIKNHRGSKMVAGALAIKPKSAAFQVEEACSPLQGSAFAYKSAFSRAALITRASGRRELLVSGTASIDTTGASVYLGDPEAQTEKTLRVIEAILQSAQMSWRDVSRAVVYFKEPRYAPFFFERMPEMSGFPLVAMHADVCRDDLLFEMELDAIVP